MNELVEGVKAIDFNPELISEPLSVDSSRAVKVSSLFVDKITGLYKKQANFNIEEKEVEEEVEVKEQEKVEETTEESVEEPVEKEEENNDDNEVEVPDINSFIDPDGTLSDIASSFEVAVAQIHAKQAEIDLKEDEIEKIKSELLIKEEKTDKLLAELEKMKKEVDTNKKEADKIIKEAELKNKELQKRIDAFEGERQRFLNNLKNTTGSIMNMVSNKKSD